MITSNLDFSFKIIFIYYKYDYNEKYKAKHIILINILNISIESFNFENF